MLKFIRILLLSTECLNKARFLNLDTLMSRIQQQKENNKL